MAQISTPTFDARAAAGDYENMGDAYGLHFEDDVMSVQRDLDWEVPGFSCTPSHCPEGGMDGALVGVGVIGPDGMPVYLDRWHSLDELTTDQAATGTTQAHAIRAALLGSYEAMASMAVQHGLTLLSS